MTAATGFEGLTIDETHEAILRTILRQEDDGSTIPAEVVQAYWKFKAPADRVGWHLTAGDLVAIVLSANGKTQEVEEYNFLKVLKRKPLRAGDPVVVEWRGERVRGDFVRVRSNQIVVILDDGTAEERKFTPDRVWLPEDKACQASTSTAT
jgi:hypothetical protein